MLQTRLLLQLDIYFITLSVTRFDRRYCFEALFRRADDLYA